ncbi:MAG TPA: site-2 protease family protein [Opitutus sp.]|nr:site-2 protease family protein [Opitutus sp.]
MLGWSINLFRVRGIQLAVHFSFFLLLAWVANEGWEAGRMSGLLWSVATLLAFFGCVVLHELGHSFTAIHFGIGVRRILLMPIGGMAEFDAIPREPARELLITLAGPAVNFVIAAILGGLVGVPSGWPLYADYRADAAGFCQLLLTWNLVMGLFNLLPVFPMDGGRIFRALLAWRMPYLRATYWAATVGKVLAALAGALALLVFHRYLTAVLFAFIYFAGEAEYRAVRRREIEDAHWREMLARVYGQPPTAEPPLLSR